MNERPGGKRTQRRGIRAPCEARVPSTCPEILRDPGSRCATLSWHGSGVPAIIIQITRPDVEALIERRLRSGAFKDAEDVVMRALQSSPDEPAVPPTKSIVELFAPLRGLDLDFDRNPSTGRPVAV